MINNIAIMCYCVKMLKKLKRWTILLRSLCSHYPIHLKIKQYNYFISPHHIIIIIIKKDWQCKAGRGRLPPYQSEDPSPTLPTYRGKEEKGKTVEDKKVESN